MTKQEALQKIEELRKFVDELDKQQSVLGHGNMVVPSWDLQAKRIIVDTQALPIRHRRFVLLDKNGKFQNDFATSIDLGVDYVKIKDVFED